jgi:O-antigen ligase
MTFFAEPPSPACTGIITVVLALMILVLLLSVMYKRVRNQTIIHFTLLIDIMFCASMILSAAQVMGMESQRRYDMKKLEDRLLAQASL